MNTWDYLPELCINGNEAYHDRDAVYSVGSESVVRTIDDIALHSGLTPILPHIDRYFHTFTKTEYIEHYYEMPVKIQMKCDLPQQSKNIPYYTPLFETKKFICWVLTVTAAEWRPPDLGSAVKTLTEICGQETIDLSMPTAEKFSKTPSLRK